MGYLYRPQLKDPTPPPAHPAGRCTEPRHGREDTCPGCGARFGKTWWVKYYVNVTMIRESIVTETRPPRICGSTTEQW